MGDEYSDYSHFDKLLRNGTLSENEIRALFGDIGDKIQETKERTWREEQQHRQDMERRMKDAEKLKQELMENLLDDRGKEKFFDHRKEGIGEKLKRDKEFMKKKQTERAEMKPDKIIYYAGVGSRNTPGYILRLMERLGERLREDAMILRSGHAPGADQAFERGAGGAAQIFLPWASFEQDVAFSASRTHKGIVVHPSIYNEPTKDAFLTAAGYHPNWNGLSQGAQKLMARNVHQIIGPDLTRPTPVEFVICWTIDGRASGGTGQAIRIAEDLHIPVYNLHDEDAYDLAFEWAWGE